MCVYLLFLDSIKIYWIENQTVRMRSMLLSTIELFVIRVWNGNRKSFDIFSDSWYDCQNEKQREKENLRLNQPVRHSFNIHNEPLGVCTSYKSIEMWCDAMWWARVLHFVRDFNIDIQHSRFSDSSETKNPTRCQMWHFEFRNVDLCRMSFGDIVRFVPCDVAMNMQIMR